MVKLQFSKGSQRWHLTIPPDLVRAKKWQKGQRLLLTFNEKGNIEIKEIELPEN